MDWLAEFVDLLGIGPCPILDIHPMMTPRLQSQKMLAALSAKFMGLREIYMPTAPPLGFVQGMHLDTKRSLIPYHRMEIQN